MDMVMTPTPRVAVRINWAYVFNVRIIIEQYGGSLKKLKNRATIWSCNNTHGHISGEDYNSKRYMHPDVHCSTICNSQDKEASW